MVGDIFDVHEGTCDVSIQGLVQRAAVSETVFLLKSTVCGGVILESWALGCFDLCQAGGMDWFAAIVIALCALF